MFYKEDDKIQFIQNCIIGGFPCNKGDFSRIIDIQENPHIIHFTNPHCPKGLEHQHKFLWWQVLNTEDPANVFRVIPDWACENWIEE